MTEPKMNGAGERANAEYQALLKDSQGELPPPPEEIHDPMLDILNNS